MPHPLRSILTSVETPQDALDQRFASARARLTAGPDESVPIHVLVPALLVIGDHGGALDRLRAAGAGGGPPAEVLAGYAAWTGDRRWLDRLVGNAGKDIVAPPGNSGWSGEAVLSLWRAARPDPEPAMAAELVRGVVEGLWHVVPNAVGESVAIEPTLPDGWIRIGTPPTARRRDAAGCRRSPHPIRGGRLRGAEPRSRPPPGPHAARVFSIRSGRRTTRRGAGGVPGGGGTQRDGADLEGAVLLERGEGRREKQTARSLSPFSFLPSTCSG